jgi:hypothetical protein
MIYDKASLVQIPSGYKSGTLYSVVPNTADGDFTVTGDPQGEATRVNKDGLIESVAADVPRLDYPLLDGVVQDCPTLLLEPSRTNSLPESENFSTNWFVIGLSVSSGISSPDGGTNAYSLVEGTGTGGKIIYDAISVSAGSVTYSLFMKKGDKRYTALLLSGVVTTSMFNVDLENGTGTTVTGSFDSTNIEEYPNGWYRISVTTTATAGNLNCNVYLMNGAAYNERNYTGNGTDKTYIFGAQLEAGSYPTSYIPTSGSAVTRTVDKCLNAGDANLFNDSEGTLFVDLENFSGNTRELTLSDGTINNRVTINFYGASAVIRFYVANGGVAQADSVFSISFNFDQRNKIAFRYKQNDFKAYINGTQVFSDTSGNTPVGLSRFDFANSNGTFNFIEGEIYQAMVFNEALSDSELQTLTS